MPYCKGCRPRNKKCAFPKKKCDLLKSALCSLSGNISENGDKAKILEFVKRFEFPRQSEGGRIWSSCFVGG
jgi:hypothetical protein